VRPRGLRQGFLDAAGEGATEDGECLGAGGLEEEGEGVGMGDEVPGEVEVAEELPAAGRNEVAPEPWRRWGSPHLGALGWASPRVSRGVARAKGAEICWQVGRLGRRFWAADAWLPERAGCLLVGLDRILSYPGAGSGGT